MTLSMSSPTSEMRKVFPGVRELKEVRDGIEIWEGKCEECKVLTLITFDGKKYRCIDCLARTD